jgi:antitoxin YefM
MLTGIKQHGIVGKDGKIEIQTSDIPEGTAVEIIVLVEQAEQDTTEYLLSTEANRHQLLQAIERAEIPDNLVVIASEEWNERYRI